MLRLCAFSTALHERNGGERPTGTVRSSWFLVRLRELNQCPGVNVDSERKQVDLLKLICVKNVQFRVCCAALERHFTSRAQAWFSDHWNLKFEIWSKLAGPAPKPRLDPVPCR